jgi:hypothetical protein
MHVGESTQWLVQNSRVCGDISSENDMEKCKEELERRARRIWDPDVDGGGEGCSEAVGEELWRRGKWK